MRNSYKYKLAAVISAMLLLSLGVAILGQKVSAAGSGSDNRDRQAGWHSAPPEAASTCRRSPVAPLSTKQTGHHRKRRRGREQRARQRGPLCVPGPERERSTSAAAGITKKDVSTSPTWWRLMPTQHIEGHQRRPDSHNIHPQPDQEYSEWNKSQPPGAPPFDVTWANEEIAIPVKCNIHPWMHGYIAVVKGPYGVSDDSGAFTIIELATGKLYLNRVAGNYGTQTAKSNRCRRQAGHRRLHLQGKITI